MSIDWEKFAQRVPAGTMVQCFPSEEEYSWGKVKWGGILLDNHFCVEEQVIRAHGTYHLERDYDYREKNPLLRLQDFEVDQTDDELFDPRWESVKFLIDGEWLTFDEIMKD